MLPADLPHRVWDSSLLGAQLDSPGQVRAMGLCQARPPPPPPPAAGPGAPDPPTEPPGRGTNPGRGRPPPLGPGPPPRWGPVGQARGGGGEGAPPSPPPPPAPVRCQAWGLQTPGQSPWEVS